MPTPQEEVAGLIWLRIGKQNTCHAFRSKPNVHDERLLEDRAICYNRGRSGQEAEIIIAPDKKCPACVAKIAQILYTPSETCIAAGKVLNKVFGGLHHVTPIKDYDYWAEVSIMASLSTTDFNNLTQLVIASHDECIRLEIECSGPRLLKLVFHKRERGGRISQSHPTMEQALLDIRQRHYAYDRDWETEARSPADYVKRYSVKGKLR